MLLMQFSAVGLVEWKVLVIHFLSFCIICVFSEPGTINSSWLSNFQGPSQSGTGCLCTPGLCLACAKGWYFIMNLGAHGRDQSVAAYDPSASAGLKMAMCRITYNRRRPSAFNATLLSPHKVLHHAQLYDMHYGKNVLGK